MRIATDCGLAHWEFEVAEDNLIPGPHPPPALQDPAAAVRAALEQPFGFPPLRRALTPDDHVTVVIDEQLPHLVELLVPLLEHIVAAGVSPSALTLLCPPPGSRQTWVDDLPEAFEDVHLEVGDPTDRRRQAYLATTRKGRRLYLNRTLVDADQIVVLSGRRYDPLLGYSGAEGAIYPALSDEQTRTEMLGRISLDLPEETPWPVRSEAVETSWLLGAPFFVQVIEADGDRLAHVVAGSTESSLEGQRLLDACWRHTVPRAADLVIATLSGDPARHTFAAHAAALASAGRVVRSGGRIVLLSQANPVLGPETNVLRAAEDPDAVLRQLQGEHTLELVPVLQWAAAAQQAHLNLLSGLPGETVEELFATPLEQPRQVQRLLDAGGSCLFLPDAHKMLAVLAES
jgi:nickel-dependent lactate racemase